MFDPVAYMQNLHSKLKTTKDKYSFVKVSSIAALEGVLQESRRHRYFFAVCDSQDGLTFRGAGSGFYERLSYYVFILGKADYGDMAKRAEVMNEARVIYRQLLSRMIKDRLQIPVLDLSQIRFYEVPPAFATGCSGLYFNFTVEEPIELQYNGADWTT
jgi:hypothetical protein